MDFSCFYRDFTGNPAGLCKPGQNFRPSSFPIDPHANPEANSDCGQSPVRNNFFAPLPDQTGPGNGVPAMADDLSIHHNPKNNKTHAPPFRGHQPCQTPFNRSP